VRQVQAARKLHGKRGTGSGRIVVTETKMCSQGEKRVHSAKERIAGIYIGRGFRHVREK
jgi:hypothetical protein